MDLKTSPVTWRLLDTPPMTAADNMAMDDTLVELKGRGETPDTIRFLQFSPRAVLVGFHQSVEEEIRTRFCHEQGIHINRRITGGGAIFFDENQLGWEAICGKAFFGLKLANLRLFRTLCEPVIEALHMLGVDAAFRPRNDIEVNGRKISGTGGTESENAFLFQGTMLVDFDVDTMLRSLRIPVEKLKAKEIDSVKERVTCLHWELDAPPSLAAIKEVIRTGFERVLGIRLEPGGLTDSEKGLFEKKREHYRSLAWIHNVKPSFKRHEVVQASYRTEGGMVRYTLVVDPGQRRMKDIYITGDFLSFPSRALFDLEAELRGLPLDREIIHRVVRTFFKREMILIPGIPCHEFLKPLDLALHKIAISRYGIPLEYCNQISVTNGSFGEILKKRPSVLLLPYCSKGIDCDMRDKKGCKVCGRCSIGSSWTMGRKRKMEVISIVSYEDLMDELERMKRAGTGAFIGCCCQPFFTKHARDFERAGIPGILLEIDSTTCYELDQAKEAYAGRFSSQTQINLELLEIVLSAADARSLS